MRARNYGWMSGLAGVVALFAFRPLAADVAPPPVQAPGPAPTATLTGTPSCSARACHGGVEPVTPPAGQTVRQNEYPLWLMRDPHARAYEVLFGERSLQIAERLGTKAPDDSRCLACHTNPRAASEAASPAERAERSSGVGCEACHGTARDWLGPHSTGALRDSASLKVARGMVPTGEPLAAAQVCAGCHVGAAADGEKGLPARDVDHDLIAAGHPRLGFEFSAYLANLPRHWEKKVVEPGHEAKLWAVGQVVAAETALRLLATRTRADHPWPEFSEYSCYACHHDLHQPSPRQQAGFPGRRPGALPWGSWTIPLTEALARRDGGPNAIAQSYRELRDRMQQPVPDRAGVTVQAGLLASTLGVWSVGLERQPWDARQVQTLFIALGEEGRTLAAADWDGAAQLYLALAALAQSMPANDAVQPSLRVLHQQLAFPSEAGQHYDSPHRFDVDRSRRYREELDRLLAVLRSR